MADNKSALVTGGSRGIGRSIVLALAVEGYTRLAIGYRKNKAQADALCRLLQEELGITAFALQADIADHAAATAMVQQAEQAFGGLDLLVCNAGISQNKLFTDITLQEWQHMFAVNVQGIYSCCHAALPGMLRRHCGKIITISSIWGIAGASCEVHYSAAKAAVIGFTKALAKEVGPSGIRVNCVAPGAVATDMMSDLTPEALALLREETPLGCIGNPRDVAASVAFLASPAADFITGQVLSPNGGIVI